MKKRSLRVLVVLLMSSIMICSISLQTFAAVPSAYFELGFNGNGVYDKAGNTQLEIVGGTVGQTSVMYDNKTYTATGYTGKADGEYIKVILDKITSAAALGQLLLSGSTFEMFVQLADKPGGTSGFMTSCNGGGVSLGLRGSTGQVNFQIGTTVQDYEKGWQSYAAAEEMNYDTGTHIETGVVVHIVGTYNPVDKNLRVYYNGELVSTGNYGTGSFAIGNGIYNQIGIGLNVAYPQESLGKYTEYTVLGSKIYDKCLSDAQVKEEYNATINALTGATSSTTNGTTTTSAQTSDYGVYLISALLITGTVFLNIVNRRKKASL